MTSSLVLVVTSGCDAGARAGVSTQPVTIGRAETSALHLRDPAVSRRHAVVSALADGVRVDACDSASPIDVGGRKVRSANISPGGAFRVGNSLVEVRGHDARADSAPAAESIDAVEDSVDSRTVLGSGALAALYELVGALAEARDAAALDASLVLWTRAHRIGVDARVDERGAVYERALVARDDIFVLDGRVHAPAHAANTSWVVVDLLPGQTLDDELRRLLVVVGRIVGATLARLGATVALENDRRELRRSALGSADRFLGKSPQAREIERLLPRLADVDATVMLLGESGVGKSFVARLLHESGKRASRPLVVTNCAAIPEGLIEAELFGHEKGAFTGAARMRVGAFEQAGDGTLFLDEIGELSLAAQAKILRALEDRQFQRLGSTRSLPFNARVVVATNRDLDAMVEAGTFRQDLFFRVCVVKLTVPPLRDRGEDIEQLAQQILADMAKAQARRVTRFSDEAMRHIRRYPWPGNVRELRNVIEQALVYGETDVVELSDMPALRAQLSEPEANDERSVTLPANAAWLERENIQAALQVTGGNRTRAAALLGLARATVYKKLQEHAERTGTV